MKKVLSTCLAALMLAGSLSTVASAELDLHQRIDNDKTFTLGNVDRKDGDTPNMKDSNLVKSYIVGRKGAAEAIYADAADMNGDGVINSKDSYLLKSVMSGAVDPASLENGKQVYKLTIGGVAISEFSIYATDAENYDNNATYAAELMQYYIKIATGVSLTIKSGAPEGHYIAFNYVDRNTELGQKLGAESYQYTVKDGSLNVYGTYRGNMYAVYEILENYLGFRFYNSEHTFIYKQRCVDIPEGTDVFFEPKMKFRYCGQDVRGDDAQIYYMPSRMNGPQVSGWAEERYGTQYGPQYINAHSHGYYWQMSLGTMPPDDGKMNLNDRYNAKIADGRAKWEADPKLDEYNWQPCATSDSDYKKLFEGMIDMLEMLDQAWNVPAYKFTTTMRKYVVDGQKSVSFSLCDNESYCSCSGCRKKKSKEGYSGLYLDLANRAARDLQEYDNGKYAGMRVHSILYNHDIPKTVRPDKNVIVFFCGQGCNNHFLGTEDCGTCMGQKPKPSNNINTNESLKAWGEFCKETGAEMWYWYYGVQYGYVLVGMPNILNLYHDIKYLYEECNVKGIYYEGGGGNNNFGTLKAYLSMKMMWEPDMSYERYTEHIKEYLYMYYGDGYEQLYEYILMQNEAAKTCGTCFISNFDKPADMYSINYMRGHYEEMRSLLVSALEMAEDSEHIARLERIVYLFDFLGLSYVYNDVYTGEKATDETKALYEERCTAMWNYMKANDIEPFDNPGLFYLPGEITFDQAPILQVYHTKDTSGKPVYNASSRAIINNFFLTGERVPEIKDGTPEPMEIAFGSYTVNY